MSVEDNRQFMKSMFGKAAMGSSDQSRGVEPPPLEAPYDADAEVVALPQASRDVIVRPDLFECISHRRSRREWTDEPLTIEQISFLLWATQGVTEVLTGGRATLRTVPSGGARHPFETYVAANKVTGLEQKVYRYLPLTHRLLPLFEMDAERREDLTRALLGQQFAAHAPVVFIWSCVPYRGEWRYTLAAHKTMLSSTPATCARTSTWHARQSARAPAPLAPMTRKHSTPSSTSAARTSSPYMPPRLDALCNVRR